MCARTHILRRSSLAVHVSLFHTPINPSQELIKSTCGHRFFPPRAPSSVKRTYGRLGRLLASPGFLFLCIRASKFVCPPHFPKTTQALENTGFPFKACVHFAKGISFSQESWHQQTCCCPHTSKNGVGETSAVFPSLVQFRQLWQTQLILRFRLSACIRIFVRFIVIQTGLALQTKQGAAHSLTALAQATSSVITTLDTSY